MKYFYGTNWMGPISNDWCLAEKGKEWTDKHGAEWSGGRIDIRGGDSENENFHPRGWEIHLPVMSSEDWNDFGDWLDDFESDELILDLDELLKHYDKPIRWFESMLEDGTIINEKKK